jgi:Caspase domain
MRKALVVGVNHYDRYSPLYGCVDDAHSVKACLERNGDGTVNFSVRLLTGTGPTDTVTCANLKREIVDLFSGDHGMAMLYFAGHGTAEMTGGYVFGSDASDSISGVSLHEVLVLANNCSAKNRLIILDSCKSGIAGTAANNPSYSELKEGTTILTACAEDQYATEENGAGVFTSLLVDALNGAAANLLGEVTPGSAYAHIDKSLGAWEQRPIFKTNIKSFASLRTVVPPISLRDLQRLARLFPEAGYEYQLDPSYEPERHGRTKNMLLPDPMNTETFSVLQQYNKLGLLVPVNAPHMWHAAMQSKTCKLTALGEHYRRLAASGRI